MEKQVTRLANETKVVAICGMMSGALGLLRQRRSVAFGLYWDRGGDALEAGNAGLLFDECLACVEGCNVCLRCSRLHETCYVVEPARKGGTEILREVERMHCAQRPTPQNFIFLGGANKI